MLTSLQTTLLNSLSCFLKGEKYTAPLDTDWDALFKESVEQAVALSCLQGLETSQMPLDVKRKWQSFAMRSLQSNVNIHSQHAEVHKLMTENQIPYVILKGSSSAYYYLDPLMRSMGDVDFLVAENDLKTAINILVEDGFTQRDMKHLSHLVFNKENVHLELHFKPAGLPDAKMGDLVKEYLKDIFSKKSEVEVVGNKFYKPSDFHHGLIILMHTYHHMLSEGIGLRHLCDWAVFCSHFEGEQFADIFQEKLSAVGLWRFAQILSCVSCKYLGIAYKSWMGKIDDVLCEKVTVDIFAGGNFGAKDSERNVQGISISNRGKDGIKKRKFGQLIISVNEMGKTEYPRMGKLLFFKHFCFIPLGFRYFFRVITGKRKNLRFFSNMKQAEERKKIYEQFQLFEVDEK